MKPSSWVGWFVVFIILLEIIAVLSYKNGTVDDQLTEFAQTITTPALLTTTFGAPVLLQDTTTIGKFRPLLNHFFMESITQLSRERIPDRVAHGKGTGAFGYFELTHEFKHLCKAKVFDTVGKRTPLVTRFSPANQRIGGSDLVRELRGFALKLYTEEGNLDFLNLNVNMFQIKDPIFFPAFVHAFDKNARTNIDNHNARWDFITQRPESLSMYMRIFGDHGIPDGYRRMHGWPIHTYELLNSCGNRTYARFHFRPTLEVKNLTSQQARIIQGEDLDFFSRDLYEAILNKNYPSWILIVQTIAENDVPKVKFDIFDVTRHWPLLEFPPWHIGRVVLNKNPENFFADIEQVAFNPGNLVSGIQGIDILFEMRVFSYRDSHLYRLGKNFNKIRVNCPLSEVNTYYKDGLPPVLDNGGGAPTYYPNSFRGPVPLNIEEPEKNSVYTVPEANNFDQADTIYRNMDEDERCRLVENIVESLGLTEQFLQDKAVNLYKMINVELAQRIEGALKVGRSRTSACKSL